MGEVRPRRAVPGQVVTNSPQRQCQQCRVCALCSPIKRQLPVPSDMRMRVYAWLGMSACVRVCVHV